MFYIILLLYFPISLIFNFIKFYYRYFILKYTLIIYKYIFCNNIRPKIRSPGSLNKISITNKQIEVNYNII